MPHGGRKRKLPVAASRFLGREAVKSPQVTGKELHKDLVEAVNEVPVSKVRTILYTAWLPA